MPATAGSAEPKSREASMRLSSFVTGLLLVACSVVAASAATPDETVRQAIAALAPKVKVEAVQDSEVPGFYEAIVGSQFVYVSKDGRYVLDGSAFDARRKSDLTEASKAKMRKAALDKVGPEKRISFEPDAPLAARHKVIVFTDVDCPFCRRFHQQIADYNAKGIAVDYLFFPLSIHPGADKKAEAVWCSSDRQTSFTEAMAGKDPGHATCPNPVSETAALAKAIGISATPTVLAEDGTQIPGQIAMSPDQLAAALDQADAAKKN
jgi:thiol:disulfide interchange protein DsbC